MKNISLSHYDICRRNAEKNVTLWQNRSPKRGPAYLVVLPGKAIPAASKQLANQAFNREVAK